MTAHDIVGGAVWVQFLVLMAAMGFASFELLFSATGRRRQFLARRRLSLVACGSVFVVLAALPFVSPWISFNAVDAILAQYLKGNISIVSASEMQAVVTMPTEMVDTLARGTSWFAVAFLVFFAVTVVARLVYLAVNYRRIRRALRNGCVLKTSSRLKIISSSHVTVPFSTLGFFRYIVVLPADVCRDREAVRMCLGHELQHIRQGDVNAEIVLSLVSPFLILNPGYWFIAGRIRNLAELSCDRAFLARDRMSARDYSLRLLATARRHLAAESQVPRAFGVPLIGSSLLWKPRKSMLKSRIEEIAAHIDDPTTESRSLARFASVSLAALILLLAVSFGTAGDWSHERIMLSTVVNLERINEINSLAQRTW